MVYYDMRDRLIDGLPRRSHSGDVPALVVQSPAELRLCTLATRPACSL